MPTRFNPNCNPAGFPNANEETEPFHRLSLAQGAKATGLEIQGRRSGVRLFRNSYNTLSRIERILWCKP
jgi:hypothetical protein